MQALTKKTPNNSIERYVVPAAVTTRLIRDFKKSFANRALLTLSPNSSATGSSRRLI